MIACSSHPTSSQQCQVNIPWRRFKVNNILKSCTSCVLSQGVQTCARQLSMEGRREGKGSKLFYRFFFIYACVDSPLLKSRRISTADIDTQLVLFNRLREKNTWVSAPHCLRSLFFSPFWFLLFQWPPFSNEKLVSLACSCSSRKAAVFSSNPIARSGGEGLVETR